MEKLTRSALDRAGTTSEFAGVPFPATVFTMADAESSKGAVGGSTSSGPARALGNPFPFGESRSALPACRLISRGNARPVSSGFVLSIPMKPGLPGISLYSSPAIPTKRSPGRSAGSFKPGCGCIDSSTPSIRSAVSSLTPDVRSFSSIRGNPRSTCVPVVCVA